MKKTLLATVLAAITTLAMGQSPTAYLCTADKAVGFAFDATNKQWVNRNFRTEEKYMISRSTASDIAWEVKTVGQKYALIFCKKDFNSSGYLFCEGVGTNFRFNNDSLRYMSVYMLGYWTDGKLASKENSFLGKEGSDTPGIEIGKCSPL